jgi:hypothetical protein
VDSGRGDGGEREWASRVGVKLARA